MVKLPKELKISEHQLQTQLMQYLRSIGYYVMRLNSGKFSVGEGRFKRFINGQDAGTPDLLAFKLFEGMHDIGDTHPRIECNEVKLLFVEVKVPGNKPTSLQTAKMEELTEYGAKCITAHSLEELIEKLNS